MNNPKISVALTTYNAERYIEAQLDSILQQSLTPFEIVVCDDCSSDRTKEILLEYLNKYQGLIRLHFNQENKGLNSNFAHAFSLCRGDFIAPSDHDDVWLPNKLQRLFDEIENYSIVHCNSEYIDQDGKSLGLNRLHNFRLETITNPFIYVFNNSVAGHAMLVRRELMDLCFPFHDRFPNDWWLAIAGSNQIGVKFLNEVLVKYRIHPKNVSDPLKKHKSLKYCSVDKNREKIRIFSFMCSSKVLRNEVRVYLLDLIDLYRTKERIWFFHFRLYRKLNEHASEINYLILKKNYKKFLILLKDSFGLKIKTLLKRKA